MIATAYWLTVVALAWGVLAMASVYPWGYVPLAALAVVAGALGRALGDGKGPALLVGGLALVAAAIGLQLVPLPHDVLAKLSPETPVALRQLDPAFAAGVNSAHPLSIHPAGTRRALFLYLSFALLLAGSTRLLSRIGAERVVLAIVILGVVVAFAGIIQRAVSRTHIYGLWAPIEGREAFGPFVNRNHFAGWMLMALPVTFGLFCAGVARGMRGVRPELRERLLWFSSPEASRLILIAVAAAVMMLSLVLTVSRSGFAAALFTVVLTVALFWRGGSSRARKVVVLATLGVLTVGVLAWAGLDAIADRLSNTALEDLGKRRGAWADAISVAERFPLIGSGINTYTPAMLLYQAHYAEVHFSAAHNDYLQIAAEGGLFVGVPVLIALAVFISQVRRRLREDRESSYVWIRLGAVVGLLAIGAQEVFDFSLQIPGNAVMFAVVCAIAIHKRPPRRDIVAPAS